MKSNSNCPDCVEMDRRGFLLASAGLATAAAFPIPMRGAEARSFSPENNVVELFGLLSDDEKSKLCFPANHELRFKAAANWSITKPEIKDLAETKQNLVENILRGITSEEGYKMLEKQMASDSGGLNSYHVAFFGNPAEADFQFVVTGRHMTIRADGNKQDGIAFGGPMVYGHAAAGFTEKPNHPDNVFWYQAKRANEVFAALDPKQREIALLEKSPAEEDIKPAAEGYRGLNVGGMSSDQKTLVNNVMKDLLAPYRQQDVDEAMSVITANGGLDKVHLSYYKLGADGKNGDLGNDQVWDIWRLEGPGFVWHFRGAPHVHGWVSLRKA